MIELQRVLQSTVEYLDRFGEFFPELFTNGFGDHHRILFALLQPDLFDSGGEAFLALWRYMCQDIAHEVDFAPLLGGADECLLQGFLDSEMCIADQQGDIFDASRFELFEEGSPRLCRFGPERLDSQYFPPAFQRDAVGDHDGGGDDTPFGVSDLFVQCVDPDEGIGLFQRTVAKRLHLLVETLVDLGHLRGRNVPGPHLLGQAFDLSSRHTVDVGLFDHRDQCLLTSAFFGDKERNVASLTDLWNHQVHRSQSRIEPSGTVSAEMAFTLTAVLSFGCAYFLFRFDLHQLIHHPFEHG